MIVDMHAHVIPKEFLARVREGDPRLTARLDTGADGQTWVIHQQGYRYPLLPGFHHLEARLADMDRAGVEVSILSVAPPLFYYTLPPREGGELAALLNDAVASLVARRPDRLAGMATVPLQDPEGAAAELERAVGLGLRGAHIGANVEGRQLDNPAFHPFFAAAEKLGVPLFLHPYYVGNKAGMEGYYLTNLLGNPFETTLAFAHLLFGGIFNRFPGLKVCLAHGGGFVPYQKGRLIHGHRVRAEPKAMGVTELPDWTEQVYFDTLLFDDGALRFLIDSVGAHRVMLGSDYPFDMGEENGAERVRALGLSRAEEQLVLGGTARELFGL